MLSSEYITRSSELNTYNLTDLKPYTRYAYYVLSYYTQETKGNITHGQSDIIYFKTLKAVPKMPYLQTLEKTSHSITVKLTINPSQYNLLKHYILGYYEIPDDSSYINNRRNYCLDPLIESNERHEVPNFDNDLKCCEEKRIYLRQNFEDALERWSDSDGDDYQICEADNPDCDENARPKLATDYSHLDKIDKLDLEFGDSVYEYVKIQNYVTPINQIRGLERTINLSWNTVEYKLEKLNSFSLYTFLLSACNIECSPYYTYSERTMPVVEDDDIDFTMTNTSNSLIVTFIPASRPNGATVAYEIQYARIEYPIPSGKLVCIPLLNGLDNNT